jgi:hypothetical protein
MTWLLKLLNYIPLNGSKTGIGIVLAIISAIQALDPEVFTQLWDLFTTSPINWGAIALIVIGLLHKWLKKLLPGVSEPLPVETETQKTSQEWGVPKSK